MQAEDGMAHRGINTPTAVASRVFIRLPRMQIPHGEYPAVYTLHYFDTVHFNSAGDYEKPTRVDERHCARDPLSLPAGQFGKIVRQNEPRSVTTDPSQDDIFSLTSKSKVDFRNGRYAMEN